MASYILTDLDGTLLRSDATLSPASKQVMTQAIEAGAIIGLTQHTTSIDLIQAITEASYQRLARIAELVLAEEKAAPKFIVSGGIQRSAQAIQRLADVMGQPLYPNDEMEASIRGAAIYVLEKLGLPIPDVKFGKPIKPRSTFAKLFAERRERQRQLEGLIGSV